MRDETQRLFAAVRSGDVAAARDLLAAGVNPRLWDGREMPIHAAARIGSLAMVEALLEGGALEWQRDAKGRTALDVARAGSAPERDAIVRTLDRPCIESPSFRAAVEAIQTGNVRSLETLLDAEPRLLHERAVEPDAYHRVSRHDYFLDPKLFWFVANNPTLVPRIAPNIVDVASVMIARGVDRADLDYALELTMSGSSARDSGVRDGLIAILLAAGATPTPNAIETAAAYGEIGALDAIVRAGFASTPAILAARGDAEALRASLASASRADVQTSFGLAVINDRLEATRIALDAGADVNAFLPVHAHSTALHHAVVLDDPDLVTLLLERGAPVDARDTLWDAMPLDWAGFGGHARARAALLARGGKGGVDRDG